ncbi:WhiB family transcriptional regulator [Microbacterium caowuchunii]|uniref:WhiB family transcriptional regulator n=1 Tax=Microbacterium caowuchunii TaxID=2614638 RepID=UPI001781B740
MSAWDDLQWALAKGDPACKNDGRFTAESGEHDAVLREVCERCPVLQQCRSFARSAPRNRTWGYFGGLVRRTKPQVRTGR